MAMLLFRDTGGLLSQDLIFSPQLNFKVLKYIIRRTTLIRSLSDPLVGWNSIRKWIGSGYDPLFSYDSNPKIFRFRVLS